MKKLLAATFILAVLIGCDNPTPPAAVKSLRLPAPRLPREHAEETHKSLKKEFPNTRISVNDVERQITEPPVGGYSLVAEGFYLVHCRDGIVWKSKLKKENSPNDMIWLHDGMLDMETLEGKHLLIPLSNIHHIEFVYEMVKKEEE